jgi:hypothetical protein
MDNNYFTQVAPYMQQDQQGLNPVFQNIAQQQANQNAALQQQMQNNQMAGQTHGSSGGMNPLAMAAMLRGNKQPGLGETTNSFGQIIKDPTYGSGNAYNNMSSGEIANMQENGV